MHLSNTKQPFRFKR